MFNCTDHTRLLPSRSSSRIAYLVLSRLVLQRVSLMYNCCQLGIVKFVYGYSAMLQLCIQS